MNHDTEIVLQLRHLLFSDDDIESILYIKNYQNNATNKLWDNKNKYIKQVREQTPPCQLCGIPH